MITNRQKNLFFGNAQKTNPGVTKAFVQQEVVNKLEDMSGRLKTMFNNRPSSQCELAMQIVDRLKDVTNKVANAEPDNARPGLTG